MLTTSVAKRIKQCVFLPTLLLYLERATAVVRVYPSLKHRVNGPGKLVAAQGQVLQLQLDPRG